jgi:hypothetical protein
MDNILKMFVKAMGTMIPGLDATLEMVSKYLPKVDSTVKDKATIAKMSPAMVNTVKGANTADELKNALKESSPNKEIANILGEEGQKQRDALANTLAHVQNELEDGEKNDTLTDDKKKALTQQVKGIQEQIDAADKLRDAAEDAFANMKEAGDDPVAMAKALQGFQDAAHPNQKAMEDHAVTKGSIYTSDADTQAALSSLNDVMGGTTSAVETFHAEFMVASEEMQGTAESAADSLDEIYRALRFRGIKIDKSFLQNQVKDVIHDATFDAASEALLDYYVLQKVDPKQAMEAIQKGADPKKFAKSVVDGWKEGTHTMEGDVLKLGEKPKATPGDDPKVKVPQNAVGGVVTNIREGIASIGMHEAIVPEGMTRRDGGAGGGRDGGGGGTMVIQLRGDAAKLFETMVDDRISYNQTKKQVR